LVSAASAVSKDIAEGFLRHSAGDFARFLAFALGSLAEAEGRLEDGVELGYFPREHCAEAFRFARRAAVAMTRLKVSQQRYARQMRAAEGPSRRANRR
jgi:four helix bundle protein